MKISVESDSQAFQQMVGTLLDDKVEYVNWEEAELVITDDLYRAKDLSFKKRPVLVVVINSASNVSDYPWIIRVEGVTKHPDFPRALQALASVVNAE